MRYQSIPSFQKHLASAAPHHLCRTYLIAISDDFERAKAINAILSYLEVPPTRLSGADFHLRTCLDAMQNHSLLGETIVVLDEVEKLTKEPLQALCHAVPFSAGYVLFGSRSKVPLLAVAVEKEGIVLDLLEEKPWDREKRLVEQLSVQAKNGGKKLDPDVPALLFERLGVDPALLESEMDKLICFAGDRPAITREDVLRISCASRTATFWQIAEDLIWEGKEIPPIDATSFHGLIPALRNQLHIGLSLATLIEEKCPADQWSRYLPKLWPKTLERRSSQAARLGSGYFRKGLEKLFDIELLSRCNCTQYRALLDRFRVQIHVR